MSDAMHWLERLAQQMRHAGNRNAEEEVRRLIGEANKYGAVPIW